MLTRGGHPNSLTHISPTGPCTLTIDWEYPDDAVAASHARPGTPTTPDVTGARATAYLTGSPLRIGTLTYHAHAWTELNDDLTFDTLDTYMKHELVKPHARPAPRAHQTRWHQHATTVLTELLTPENYLALHRADTHHRINDARLDVTRWASYLDTARHTLRHTEILSAVLDLEDPTHRAIGLRLAPTWAATPDELIAAIAAITGTAR